MFWIIVIAGFWILCIVGIFVSALDESNNNNDHFDWKSVAFASSVATLICGGSIYELLDDYIFEVAVSNARSQALENVREYVPTEPIPQDPLGKNYVAVWWKERGKIRSGDRQLGSGLKPSYSKPKFDYLLLVNSRFSDSRHYPVRYSRTMARDSSGSHLHVVTELSINLYNTASRQLYAGGWIVEAPELRSPSYYSKLKDIPYGHSEEGLRRLLLCVEKQNPSRCGKAIVLSSE